MRWRKGEGVSGRKKSGLNEECFDLVLSIIFLFISPKGTQRRLFERAPLLVASTALILLFVFYVDVPVGECEYITPGVVLVSLILWSWIFWAFGLHRRLVGYF